MTKHEKDREKSKKGETLKEGGSGQVGGKRREMPTRGADQKAALRLRRAMMAKTRAERRPKDERIDQRARGWFVNLAKSREPT